MGKVGEGMVVVRHEWVAYFKERQEIGIGIGIGGVSLTVWVQRISVGRGLGCGFWGLVF